MENEYFAIIQWMEYDGDGNILVSMTPSNIQTSTVSGVPVINTDTVTHKKGLKKGLDLFRKGLSKKLYLIKRAGLLWVFPLAPAAILGNAAAPFAEDYMKWYSYSVAGRVDKIIVVPEPCTDPLLGEEADCFKEYKTTTIGGVVAESTQSGSRVKKARKYSRYPAAYDAGSLVSSQYPIGQRPGGVIPVKYGTEIETTTYVQDGDFLGSNTRYVPKKVHSTPSIRTEFSVNVSTLKGANAFAQASKYALTPENTPDSASIIAVGDTLRAAIAALPAETQDQVTVSVLGAASPEGDDIKNQQLAEERAKYVQEALIKHDPQLAKYLQLPTGIVRKLTTEDTIALARIIGRLSGQGIQINSTRELVTAFESQKITLSPEDTRALQDIYRRTTQVFLNTPEQVMSQGSINSKYVLGYGDEVLYAILIAWLIMAAIGYREVIQRAVIWGGKDYIKYTTQDYDTLSLREIARGKLAEKHLTRNEIEEALPLGVDDPHK